MAMTEKDIATLARGMAPAIKEAIAAQIRPLADRLTAIEEGRGSTVKMDGLSLNDATDAIVDGLAEAMRDELKTLKGEVTNLASRVAKAEAKAAESIDYFGVWQPGSYRKGAAVTWDGSLFIAQTATHAKPGESGEPSRAWRLAVKRGRDGKDAS